MPVKTMMTQLQAKVSQTILAASAFLFLVIIVNDTLLGYYTLAAIKFPIVLLFAWGWVTLKRKGFHERNTHFVNIPVLVFFTVNYLSNQGTDGPTLIAMLTMFVVYPILLSNTTKWVYSIATLVLIAVLLFLGTDEENLIRSSYGSREEQFYDHLATHTAVGIYITVLVSIVINFYRNQTTALAIAKLELSTQIEHTQAEKRINDELLGILAHDVKGPVINLRQLIQLRGSGAISEEALKTLMVSVDARLTDLLSSVDNVLSQTKAEANRLNQVTVAVHPDVFTKTLLEGIRYRFEVKKQTLAFESGLSATYSIDDTFIPELSIILKNMVDNAIKYSPENSSIEVRLRATDSGIRWEVADSGQGIPEKLASSLFSRAITSKEGTGIGLYLCKSIADRIGAKLWFDTSAQGTTFYVELNDNHHLRSEKRG